MSAAHPRYTSREIVRQNVVRHDVLPGEMGNSGLQTRVKNFGLPSAWGPQFKLTWVILYIVNVGYDFPLTDFIGSAFIRPIFIRRLRVRVLSSAPGRLYWALPALPGPFIPTNPMVRNLPEAIRTRFGMLTGMRYVRSINRGSIPHRTNKSFSSPQRPKWLTFRNKLLPSSSGYKRCEDGNSSLHPNYGIYPPNRTASQPKRTWSSHSPRWETQNNFHMPNEVV
jgi:hypothetical protein